MTQPVTPPPPPAATPYTVSIDISKLPSVATALGVSLVSAAVVMSAAYSRAHGHLDKSNFTMGVLATLGLLLVAGAAQVMAPVGGKKEMLVSWPGAFGAAGVGVMLATLITNDKVEQHVAPIAALAIAVLGYLVTRSTPFVLVALGSLAILYGRIFDDLFDTNTDNGGGNVFMLIGGGVLVFVVAATAAGWLLPATRVVTGVVTGIGGLVAMFSLLGVLAATRAISSFFYSTSYDELPPGASFDDSGSAPRLGFAATHEPAHDPFKNDVYMILLYCLALVALWAVCALLTDHVAFRLLVLATAITIIPMASFALITHHPTWWEVVTTLLGGLVLGGLGLRAVNGTPPATSAPAPAPAA